MFYIELEHTEWDFSRLRMAWQQVVKRYKKQLRAEASIANIVLLDCSKDSSDILLKKQYVLRQELLKEQSSHFQAHGFVIKATKAVDGRIRLFCAFKLTVLDGSQFYFLWREWQAYYQDSQTILALSSHQTIPEYWQGRLSKLPSSPKIAAKKLTTDQTVLAISFEHHQGIVTANDYRRLKVLAQQEQLSLTLLLWVAIQDIVASYVGQTDFRLNLILGNRLPLYPYLGDHADYATSVVALPLARLKEKSFLARAQALALRLREDAKYLTTAILPKLQQAELEDKVKLSFQIECNLQQGLRQTLLATPADIVYCTDTELPINYAISVWEQDGQLKYRCSMPKEFSEANRFYLHQLLADRLQAMASTEKLEQFQEAEVAAIVDASNEFSTNEAVLHKSIVGLLQYEVALKAMVKSLRQRETNTYATQFKAQKMALSQCAGNLWSKVDKPPYVVDVSALFKGHNVLGEMLQRDAFERAQQQIEKQWPHIENLKKIFKESPPPTLSQSPAIKAVSEFKRTTVNSELSVQEYQQAIKKLEAEVFGGSK